MKNLKETPDIQGIMMMISILLMTITTILATITTIRAALFSFNCSLTNKEASKRGSLLRFLVEDLLKDDI